MKRIYGVLIVVTIFSLLLTGCKMNYPGAAAKATATNGPVDQAGQQAVTNPTDAMGQIHAFATQTAFAEQSLNTPQPGMEQTVEPPANPGEQATPGAPGAEVTPVDSAQPGSPTEEATPAQPANPAQPVAPTQPGAAIQPANPAQPPEQQPGGVIQPVTPGNQPANPQAPANPPQPMPTQGPPPASYTLMKNEFPFCIARRFNVDPAELLSLNGLSSYSVYSSGMQLRIPQSGKTFPGNRSLIAHPATHTVAANETIFSIACAYGDVDPMAIAALNGLQAPYQLTAGSTLQIP